MKFLIGGLLLLAGLSMMNLPPVLLGLVAVVGSALLWGCGGYYSVQALLGSPVTALGGLISVDGLSGFFLAIVSLVGGAVLLNVLGDMHSRRKKGESDRSLSLYLGLTIAFLLTMVLSLGFKNLGIIWVCVEGTTLVSTLLIGFETHRTSLEAAWKYVILCTVGLSCSLLGLILLLYGGSLAGIPGALDPEILAGAAVRIPAPLLKLAFVLLFIGFATKAGFAPLHSWLPDAHSQAPAPTSALLSGLLLNCSLYAIIRAQTVMIAAGLGGFSRTLLLIFGCCSLFLATLFLLVQSDLKRMLAYSSIEHMGIIILGLGLATPMAAFASAVHILGHSLAKALAFLSAGELVALFHSHEMNRMVGTLRRMPMGGGGLALALVALAGMPPFPLFFTELMLVAAAFAAGKVWLGLALLAFLSVAFTGLAFQGTRILLGEDAHHHHHRKAHEEEEEEEEEPGEADHADEEETDLHVRAEVMEAFAAGAGWRNAALVCLTILLVGVPVVLFSPFAQVMQTVGGLMTGGAQ